MTTTEDRAQEPKADCRTDTINILAAASDPKQLVLLLMKYVIERLVPHLEREHQPDISNAVCKVYTPDGEHQRYDFDHDSRMAFSFGATAHMATWQGRTCLSLMIIQDDLEAKNIREAIGRAVELLFSISTTFRDPDFVLRAMCTVAHLL